MAEPAWVDLPEAEGSDFSGEANEFLANLPPAPPMATGRRVSAVPPTGGPRMVQNPATGAWELPSEKPVELGTLTPEDRAKVMRGEAQAQDISGYSPAAQQFLAGIPEQPQRVLIDPDSIKKAKVLSATLDIPFSQAHAGVDALSAEFSRQDPGWMKEAEANWKVGWANVYTSIGRAAEYLGMKQIGEDYTYYGKKLEQAYIPHIRKEEFTYQNLTDPRYLAMTVIQNVPAFLSLIPAAVLGAYAGGGGAAAMGLGATGRLILGSIGGGVFGSIAEGGMEAGQAYDDAVNSGASVTEAEQRASYVWSRNIALLSGTNAAELLLAFTPLKYLGPGVNKMLARRVLATAGKLAGVGVMEAGEEAFQEGIQQMARGEQLHWSPQMAESAAIGAIFGIGLGGAGSVYEALTSRIERNMPDGMREEYTLNRQVNEAMGQTPQQATTNALDTIAETPAGASVIEKTMKELNDIGEGKPPPVPTDADLQSSIDLTEQVPQVAAEPSDLISDEDLNAIASGESSVDEAFGLPAEEEIAPRTPEEAAREEQFTQMLREGEATQVPVGIPRDVRVPEGAITEKVGEELTPEEMAKGRQMAAEMGLPTGEPTQGPAPGREYFVSEEKYQQTLAALKEKTSGLHAGIDPTILADYVTIGAYHIERGLVKFADWAKAMTVAFGEAIKPHLQEIWKQTNDYIRAQQPAKAVKRQIRLTTGQERIAKMVREDVALREGLRKAARDAQAAYKAGSKDALDKAKAQFKQVLLAAQAKAETFGFREGFKVAEKLTRKDLIQAFKDDQANIHDTQKMLIGYIEENLPTNMRGKYLNAIIQNLTKVRQESVIRSVDQLREKLNRQNLIKEIEALKTYHGNISLDYQRRLDDLLGDIDTKKITQKTLEKLAGLQAYAEREGMPSGVSPRMLRQLERLSQTPAESMTTEDLKELVEMGNHLRALGKLKQQLKNKYNQREREKNRKALAASSYNQDPKNKDNIAAMASYYTQMELLAGPRVAERIDGYRDTGENQKYAWDLVDKETEADFEYHAEAAQALEEIKTLGINEINDDLLSRLMVNIRQLEGATDAVNTLMDHYGFEEVPPLSEQEAKIIPILEKYSNVDRDEIAALHEERTNTPFVKLERYILPLKYQGEYILDTGEAILEHGHRMTRTAQGFTMERQKGVKKLPRIDVFDVFLQGIQDRKRYLKLQPVIDDIAPLVKSKEYLNSAGQLATNWWKDHLDIVSRGGWSVNAHSTPFTNALRAARGNMTEAILGWKLTSTLVQPLAVIQAMAEAYPRFGSLATVEMMSSVTHSLVRPSYANQYIETSKALQERRHAGGEVAIEEALLRQGTKKGLWAWYVRSSLKPLLWADVKTAAGVQMQFEKTLTKYGFPNAKREAEHLMRLVSSSSETAFRPHILARGESARTVFTFGSFLLNAYGQISHDLISKRLLHTPGWKAKYAAIIGLGIIAAGSVAEGDGRKFIWELIHRRELPMPSHLQRLMLAIPSYIPLFGQIIDSYKDAKGAAEIPIQRVIEDVFAPLFNPKKAKAWSKAAEAAITLRYGVPGTAQFFDILEGTFEVEKKGGQGQRLAR